MNKNNIFLEEELLIMIDTNIKNFQIFYLYLRTAKILTYINHHINHLNPSSIWLIFFFIFMMKTKSFRSYRLCTHSFITTRRLCKCLNSKKKIMKIFCTPLSHLQSIRPFQKNWKPTKTTINLGGGQKKFVKRRFFDHSI